MEILCRWERRKNDEEERKKSEARGHFPAGLKGSGPGLWSGEERKEKKGGRDR